MHNQSIRHLPIVDAECRLLGLLTENQVLAAADELPCTDVMNAEPVTVHGDSSLFAALRLSCEMRLSAIPVVSTVRRLEGIITRGDLLAASYRLLGLDRPGVCVEFALIEHVEDTLIAFDALHRSGIIPLSAVVGSVRDDGDEPAIYIRIPKDTAQRAEKALIDAGLIALVPENQEPDPIQTVLFSPNGATGPSAEPPRSPAGPWAGG